MESIPVSYIYIVKQITCIRKPTRLFFSFLGKLELPDKLFVCMCTTLGWSVEFFFFDRTEQVK